jgi:hypothetical protein
VHSYESELKVVIGSSTVGKYICRASVKGFREVTAAAEIFMKGPPRILRQDPIQVTHLYKFVQDPIRVTHMYKFDKILFR